MGSRPSSFIVPNSLEGPALRRFITNMMEQIDKLQGNIADNAATGRQRDIITEDQLTSITGQAQELAAGLDDLIAKFDLTNSLLQGMSDAIAQQALVDTALRGSISAQGIRLNTTINSIHKVRDNINTNASNIDSLSSTVDTLLDRSHTH